MFANELRNRKAMEEQRITIETAKIAEEKNIGNLIELYGNGYEYVTEDGIEMWTSVENGVTGKEKTTPVIKCTQSLLHKVLREEHNILISVYSNASGYLWEAMKAVGGTTMRWSEYEGDDEESGTYTTYEKAMEDALQYALQTIKK